MERALCSLILGNQIPVELTVDTVPRSRYNILAAISVKHGRRAIMSAGNLRSNDVTLGGRGWIALIQWNR